MSTNTTIAVIDGVVRLRTGLAGHDLKDPALDQRYLTFDSAWTNAFRLLKGGVVAGGSLSTQSFSYPANPVPGTRTVRRIPVTGATVKTPALAWATAGSGTIDWYPAGRLSSLPGISTSYQKAYRTCAVNLATNEIKVSPSYNNRDYAYLVFNTDATATESTGPNGGRIGVHPLYGMGAFISRPGFDHLTCSLDDMMLTTSRNMVQISETGTAVNNVWSPNDGTRIPGDAVSGGPFGGDSAFVYAARITLSRSYPDYPPVITYRMDTGYIDRLPTIFWISSNEIIISGLLSGNSVRYAILSVDPAYTPAADTGRIKRIRFFNGALDITKHNINWESAAEADFLFRSNRQTPRFTGFNAFATSFPTGVYSLPTAAPVGAGPSFAFFLVSEPTGGWWCGCGYTDMQNIVGSGGVYNSWWRGAVINRSQYRWYKDTAITWNPLGWIGSMNVSDF